MILHRSSPVWPFHALLTYLGLLVSLTVPIRMVPQTSVQPGTFGVKLSGYENLVGGGASVGRGGGAGGSTESEVEVTPQYKTSSGTVVCGPRRAQSAGRQQCQRRQPTPGA